VAATPCTTCCTPTRSTSWRSIPTATLRWPDYATTRLREQAASRARSALYPYYVQWTPDSTSAEIAVPDLSEKWAAAAWLDADLQNVLAAATHAVSRGRLRHALGLATAVDRHLSYTARLTEAHSLHSSLVPLVRGSRDRTAECWVLWATGRTLGQLGRYLDAKRFLDEAERLSRHIDVTYVRAASLNGLGLIHFNLGEFDRAQQHGEAALELAGRAGDSYTEYGALGNLGIYQSAAGNHDEATRSFERAMSIAREIGDPGGEASMLEEIGIIQMLQEQAVRAVATLRTAIARAAESGFVHTEVTSRNSLGNALLACERVDEADGAYRSARTLARQIGVQFEMRGDTVIARQHLIAELDIHVASGSRLADAVHAKLDELDEAQGSPTR